MIRKSLLIVCIALLAASCGGEKTETTADTVAAPVTIVAFNEDPEAYVDKTVEITGTVDHICRHGGKRLFIMGDDPHDRVKIESGEKIAAFDVTLEGSKIKVTGIGRVVKMDTAYLDDWEAEACSEEVKANEGKSADEQAAEAEQQIEKMRAELAESGKEYIGFYHIECLSFEELQ